MNDYYVYTHYVNGKVFYVGKGRKNRAYETRSRNKYWWNTIKKYGEPVIEIIYSNLSETDAYLKESELIETYGLNNLTNMVSYGPISNGYDKTGKNNPMYGKEHSTKSKRKMSEIALKLQNGKYPRSTETINKLSNSLKTIPKSKSHCNNMSIAQKNIIAQKCPHCNKVGTHNMKRYHFDNCKVIQPTIDRYKTPTWKGYIIVEDNMGNITKYNSMIECSKTLKVDVHGISGHIKNGTTYKRGIYKGYKFKLQ
jgi:hypothetical protein